MDSSKKSIFVLCICYSLLIVRMNAFVLEECMAKIEKLSENDENLKLANEITLETEMSKCVEFDLTHQPFIEFCLKVATKMIRKNACREQTTQPMICILATHYFGKRYRSLGVKKDGFKQPERPSIH